MLDLLFNASNTSKLLHYDYHYDKVVSRKVPSLVQLFRLLFFSLLHSNGRNAIASHSCRYTCIMHAYQNAIINQIIYAYFFVCVLFSKYTLVSHKKTPGHFRVRGVSFVAPSLIRAGWAINEITHDGVHGSGVPKTLSNEPKCTILSTQSTLYHFIPCESEICFNIFAFYLEIYTLHTKLCT